MLPNENVVDHVSERLLSGDTLLGAVFGNRIVILPVVVDCLGDAWVENSQERDECTRIGATVGDVCGGVARQIASLLKEILAAACTIRPMPKSSERFSDACCCPLRGSTAFVTTQMMMRPAQVQQ